MVKNKLHSIFECFLSFFQYSVHEPKDLIPDEHIDVGNDIDIDDEDESNSQPNVDIPDISIVPPSSQDHEYHSGEILKLLQVILQKDQKLAEKDKKIALYQRHYWNLRKSNRHIKLRMAKKR